MLYVLPFPAIDPVLVEIGPFAIRWYALAYVVGILIGWRYARGLAARGESPLTPVLLDDFVTWAVLGIVLGGRLGYILFYDLAQYLANPLQIFAVWHGGMSFHGGLAGMILAMLLFARRHKLRFFHLADPVAAATGSARWKKRRPWRRAKRIMARIIPASPPWNDMPPCQMAKICTGVSR